MPNPGDAVDYHFMPSSDAPMVSRRAAVLASYEDDGVEYLDLEVAFEAEDHAAFGSEIPTKQIGHSRAPNNAPPTEIQFSGTWTSR